jgi:hypothetical protein
MHAGKCRFCGNKLKHTFCDLGQSPLSNFYLKQEELLKDEPFFALHVYVCDACFLVQLGESQSADKLFSHDYAYFSSYSDSWLAHAKKYVYEMINRFSIDSSQLIIEIASNDGYLLKFFKENQIPVLGIEPAANVAAAAQKLGIPTLVKFFGTQTAKELLKDGQQADLLLGNNVLAHVPDLNDFVNGMKIALKAQGLITMEFPHLLRLMEQNQFDTIYHEHFSYFSFLTVEKVFAKHGLALFDVEELSTHGGSLRIFARHDEDHSKPVSQRVDHLKKQEISYGLNQLSTYLTFQSKVTKIKEQLHHFLYEAKKQGKTVAAYGAPAKGNTLLNYCGIGTDLLAYTVDRNPHKQGRYLPGTHIPIKDPEHISRTKPDYLLILPWNLKEEIMQQMAGIKSWGGKFVVPIPELEVLQ